MNHTFIEHDKCFILNIHWDRFSFTMCHSRLGPEEGRVEIKRNKKDILYWFFKKYLYNVFKVLVLYIVLYRLFYCCDGFFVSLPERAFGPAEGEVEIKTHKIKTLKFQNKFWTCCICQI